jgi:hypothetical protein
VVGWVIVAMAFGRSVWIVNPTRWVGIRLRFGIVLPLVPGFPLLGGWLVKGLVVLLVVLVVLVVG